MCVSNIALTEAKCTPASDSMRKS